MLRERAHYLGGALRLSAGEGKGAVLTVTLPKKVAALSGA
jgi:signal transduction histidine kinase